MAKSTVKVTIPAGLVRATAAQYTKHRVIGLSIGEVGSRKTRFWLEAPGPIAIFSLDQGLEGVVNGVLDDAPDKEIQVWEREWFPTKDEDMQDKAIELRDEFLEKWEEVITSGHFRTAVVDKETDMWALFRYAEFGPDGNDAPRNYPALNQRYRKMVNLAKASDLNVGFIEGMKDRWGEKVNKTTGAKGVAKSGDRIRAGFNELDGLVHMVLTHSGVGPDSWAIEVGKVRGPGAIAVAGSTLSFEECETFASFAQMVFPDTDDSDWA